MPNNPWKPYAQAVHLALTGKVCGHLTPEQEAIYTTMMEPERRSALPEGARRPAPHPPTSNGDELFNVAGVLHYILTEVLPAGSVVSPPINVAYARSLTNDDGRHYFPFVGYSGQEAQDSEVARLKAERALAEGWIAASNAIHLETQSKLHEMEYQAAQQARKRRRSSKKASTAQRPNAMNVSDEELMAACADAHISKRDRASLIGRRLRNQGKKITDQTVRRRLKRLGILS